MEGSIGVRESIYERSIVRWFGEVGVREVQELSRSQLPGQLERRAHPAVEESVIGLQHGQHTFD
jgi:hypothetical protein